MDEFYLGTPEVSWLRRDDVRVPLFISLRRFDRQKKWPTANINWALDSGGFTELLKFGGWTFGPAEYVMKVRALAERVGRLDWAAPQDWMCEAPMLAKTGRTVLDHQRLTVDNYLQLQLLGPDLSIIPALQGQTIEDYLRCVTMYEDAGVDLAALPRVGLGSVCRRQHTAEIGEIVDALFERDLKLHGFGCKAGAVRRYGPHLASADSMAWSRGGRTRGLCDYKSRCANCLHWALDWRRDVLAAL